MCLLTNSMPPSSEVSTTRTTPRNSNSIMGQGRSPPSSGRRVKVTKNNSKRSTTPKNNGNNINNDDVPPRRNLGHRARIWLFLIAGSCWSMYSLHKTIGRDELSNVLQKEIEQESKYIATLFDKAAIDAQALIEGKSLHSEAQAHHAASGLIVDPREAPPAGFRHLASVLEARNTSNAALRAAASLRANAPPQQLSPQQHTTVHHQHHQLVDFSQFDIKRHHAIVIPYRDRRFHLEQFIEHMGPYLRRNFPHDTFELWIMEQDDKFLFNRAWLTNVAIASIKHQNRNFKYQQAQQKAQLQETGTLQGITVPPPPHCIILHDVDLIPTVNGVPYTNCTRPMQLGSELAHFNNSVPYPVYTGGVGPTMTLEHWNKINGMSNDYFGWGGEDDDLWHRLRMSGLLKKAKKRPPPPVDPETGKLPKRYPKFWPPEIERPPKGLGRFRPISEAETVHHNQKTHNEWNRIGYMLELMQNNSARWKKDGLSDLKMTVTGDAMTITHMESIDYDNSTLQTDPSVLAVGRGSTTTITKKHYATAKQPGSIISALSIEPKALASFAAIHHIKAIPKLTALEYIHITQTEGGRVERAGANAQIAWGACHYKHALQVEMNCPDRSGPELEGRAKLRQDRFAHDPWHSPLQDFEENPYAGRPTFTVVRNPYDRLIEYFFCPWNGFKGAEVNITSFNQFIQKALYPEQPKKKEEEEEKEKEKTEGAAEDKDKKKKKEEEDKKKKKKKKEEEPPPPIAPAFLHLRPQFHYVFASNSIADHSRPFVTHILRYEKLEEEFPKLMKLYNLEYKVKLPLQPLGTKPPRAMNFTRLDFEPETLKMIHKFYKADFVRFRYPQIRVIPKTDPPTKEDLDRQKDMGRDVAKQFR